MLALRDLPDVDLIIASKEVVTDELMQAILFLCTRSSEAIEVMAEEGLPVQTACQVLKMSESGFYEW